MATSILSFRAPKEFKARLSEEAKVLGIPLSTRLINLFKLIRPIESQESIRDSKSH